jgi:RNA polymerase sigma-70 factor (ECF subfamily)
MGQRFQELVVEYQDRVFRLARHCVGSHEEAEDITQEVLVRLWRNLDRIEPAGLWPWLVRVTRNASIDVLRRRGTYRAVVGEDPEETAVRRARTEIAGPDRVTEAVEFRRHLEQALRQIEEPYRSIVILREIEQLKYDEISQALGLPLNTVKVYLHRGRRMLRRMLKEHGEP